MHIHIAKINPAVRMALVTSAWGKTPFSNFITIPNPVGPGHPMRVKFVQVQYTNATDVMCAEQRCTRGLSDAAQYLWAMTCLVGWCAHDKCYAV